MKKIVVLLMLVAVFTVVMSNIVKGNKKKIKSKYITVVATAYCPCAICCGKNSPGITKTGRNAYLSGVAVDPSIIPLGSHMDIPGYNRGPNKNGSWILCDDIGGAIKGKRIDVRFKKHEDAVKWGRKTIRVRIHIEE